MPDITTPSDLTDKMFPPRGEEVLEAEEEECEEFKIDSIHAERGHGVKHQYLIL